MTDFFRLIDPVLLSLDVSCSYLLLFLALDFEKRDPVLDVLARSRLGSGAGASSTTYLSSLGCSKFSQLLMLSWICFAFSRM